MADYLTYSASISATANSTAVTGSGTAFITDGVRSGDIIYFIESTGPVGYVIASVESATALTLATEYEGSTAGSKTVVVTRRYGEEQAADTYRLLNSYVQSLEDTVSVSQAGIRFTYSTTTTDSDPGAGIFRFNNATFASITNIFVDNADFNGVTVTTLLDSWDDSANATDKGKLRFQKVGDPTVFREFTISGAITDGTGYRKIPVTPSVSNDTWTDGDTFVVAFTRTGDDGTDGYDPGFRFAFSTTTTDSDPGAGTVRFDNANAALATYAYIDNADAAAADVTAWLDGMDDSTESNHKGYLRIQKIGDPAIYREFVVTGAVVNGTGYRKVPIDLVAEAGSLADGAGIVLHFTRTGSAGTNGTNGVDGYQSGYRLEYSTTTTAADPGAGVVRFNNLVMPSVTEIYIDNVDDTGATITTWLDGLDDSDSAIRGYLRFQDATDPANYAEFGVNGAVVDSTGYRTVPVVAISSSGAFSNGDILVATFYRSGSAGSATIADGNKGDITVSGSGSVWEMTAATPLADLKTKWTPASASGPASLQFSEDTDNGTNKVTLQAPSSLAADATVTLPSTTGTLATTSSVVALAAQTYAAADQAQARKNISAALKGHIHGLTLSNNGTDATNDIDIAAGEAASTETDPVLMILASALTKRLDASWGVGTNQGGLDTGSIADTTYHVWLIQRSDTGVVDVLFSTSATSPTMPSGYDRKRRIGSIIRASAAIRLFTQQGDAFYLTTGVADYSSTSSRASALLTMTVPAGIICRPFFTYELTSAGTSSNDISVQFGHGFGSSSPYFLNRLGDGVYEKKGGTYDSIFTNTSAQIYLYVGGGGVIGSFAITTYGWHDTRGRNA